MPDETLDRWGQERGVIADMKRVGAVPDSTRPDGVVTTPEFSGHKSIYLANLEGFLGGRFPALLKERDQLVERGDQMAAQIEARWSGPGGCSCACCSAAKAWRESRAESNA